MANEFDFGTDFEDREENPLNNTPVAKEDLYSTLKVFYHGMEFVRAHFELGKTESYFLLQEIKNKVRDKNIARQLNDYYNSKDEIHFNSFLRENLKNNKRKEEFRQFVYKIVMKELFGIFKKNNEEVNGNFEEKFYEFHFRSYAEIKGIPLNWFYDPIKRESKKYPSPIKNSRFKTLNKDFFKQIFEHEEFRARFVVIMNDQKKTYEEYVKRKLKEKRKDDLERKLKKKKDDDQKGKSEKERKEDLEKQISNPNWQIENRKKTIWTRREFEDAFAHMDEHLGELGISLLVDQNNEYPAERPDPNV